MKVLTKKVAEKHKIKRTSAPTKATLKPSKTPKKTDAVESLIVTVADLVKTTTEANTNAVALIDKLAIRIGTQDTKAPEIVMPERAKKWRFTVTKRDQNRDLHTVEAERME